MRLSSLADLARLASSMAGMGVGVYVIHFPHNEKHYCGLLVTLRDYYKYYGVPLFYYVELDAPLKGKYIVMKVDDSGEKVGISEGVRAGLISVPIVSLTSKPNFLEV